MAPTTMRDKKGKFISTGKFLKKKKFTVKFFKKKKFTVFVLKFKFLVWKMGIRISKHFDLDLDEELWSYDICQNKLNHV